METTSSSERPVDFNGIHGVISQKIIMYKLLKCPQRFVYQETSLINMFSRYSAENVTN
jgi:hypothetical protein